MARALLGVGGAMIMPATLSILRQVFPDRRERALAIGIWSAVAAVGAAVGPLLGGFLVENFWWGSVFLVNIPLMAVALPVGRWLLPESTRRAERPLGRARRARWRAGGLFGLVFGREADRQRQGLLDALTAHRRSLLGAGAAGRSSYAASGAGRIRWSTCSCSPGPPSAPPSAASCSPCSRWSAWS